MFVFISYEPELHPAATYRIKNLKATIQVFSTGSITVTGMSLLHTLLTFFTYSFRAHQLKGLRSCCHNAPVTARKRVVNNLIPQRILLKSALG